jgi:ubiquinone/menaquinone biosynthesis C-methylase UbiE
MTDDGETARAAGASIVAKEARSMPAETDHNARVLDQFAQQAEAYAALVGSVRGRAPALDALLATVDPRPEDRLLDVGCGPGHRVVALAPLVAQATGFDLTPEMLDQARALQRQAGVANVAWAQGDATALPFADGAFTLVMSQAMFHHASDPAGTLAEMRRVCAAGGRIAVNDLTPAPEKAAAFDAIEILRDPSHAHALTLAELRGLGADLGLEEIAVRPQPSEMPIEPVLAASRPPPGVLERVRELYERDAASGADALGMGARFKDGQLWASYPMTLVAWRVR